MNFPYTRHFQRYEYALAMGYGTCPRMIDIGCARGAGTAMLIVHCPDVYALDPMLLDPQIQMELSSNNLCLNTGFPHGKSIEGAKAHLVPFTLENYVNKHPNDKPIHTAFALEVIEHVGDPEAFLDDIANLVTDNLFITTPLCDVTRKTRNTEHFQEFSKLDFDLYVTKNFEIVDKVYQLSDLRIVKDAEFRGDSLADTHVVQMIWAKKK